MRKLLGVLLLSGLLIGGVFAQSGSKPNPPPAKSFGSGTKPNPPPVKSFGSGDYWREIKDEAGQKFNQFLFVEMDTDNGWFQMWRGEEIDAIQVSVL